MSAPDPAQLLTQFYPEGSYNFDAIPPRYTYGPLKSLIQGAVTEGLDIYTVALENFYSETTVQTATGVYLRNHGVLYGVTPFVGESDDDYRERILAAIKTGMLTIPAIQAAVQNWFNSNYGAAAPTIIVLDLQSNPTVAAEVGLLHNEFLILLEYTISSDFGAFCNYCYCDYNAFVIDVSINSYTPSAALILLLNRIKSAGTFPVWDTEYTFD